MAVDIQRNLIPNLKRRISLLPLRPSEFAGSLVLFIRACADSVTGDLIKYRRSAKLLARIISSRNANQQDVIGGLLASNQLRGPSGGRDRPKATQCNRPVVTARKFVQERLQHCQFMLCRD